MPRRARLVLPNQPLRVTQRGANRAEVFIDDRDRHDYRRLLCEACATSGEQQMQRVTFK